DWPTLSRLGLPVNRALLAPGLDRFKTHAGFAPEKIHLALVTHPRWRPFLEKIPQPRPKPNPPPLPDPPQPRSPRKRPPLSATAGHSDCPKGPGDHARSPIRRPVVFLTKFPIRQQTFCDLV
ncbi:MAG: hypothetical protein ACOVLK_03355, partial [Terrimicrobiaceae bacterium]